MRSIDNPQYISGMLRKYGLPDASVVITHPDGDWVADITAPDGFTGRMRVTKKTLALSPYKQVRDAVISMARDITAEAIEYMKECK